MTSMYCSTGKVFLLGSAVGLMSSMAHAQSLNEDQQSVPEIVVTALKRDTNIQSTPVAISAVTGDAIAQMGISDSTGLSRVSPGLVITPSAFAGSRLTVRNIYAAGEATVGLYYDETPISGSAGVGSDAGGTTPAIRTFDLERVEVLRGPQGTLYGSSSMAGAVKLIYAKPNLSEWSGVLNAQVNAVEGGGMGYTAQGVLNAPLVDGKIGVRALAFHERKAGYIDYFKLGRDNANVQEASGGRLMVRMKPVDNLTIDLMAAYQGTEGSLNDYFLADGLYRTHFEELQPIRDRFEVYSATAYWDTGPVALTAIASHSHRYVSYSYSIGDFYRVLAGRFPPGSPPFVAINAQVPAVANSPQYIDVNSAELRAASSSGGALQWTAGAFYSDRKGNFQSNLRKTDAVSGLALPISPATLISQRIIEDGLKQVALFGEVSYDITARLSVTGGIRYYDYTRDVYNLVTVPNALVGIVAGPAVIASSSEDGLLYKANASFKFTDRVMGYVTAANGMRPGGVNQLATIPADLQAYRSDSLWNYEAGIKSEWFGRRLVANADIFQIDWKNMQTTGLLANSNFIFIANAGSARIRGLEAEFTAYPIRGLQLQASGSYIHGVLTSNQSNQTLIAAGRRGDVIPRVPKMTLQGSAQYSWTLGSGFEARARYDMYYTGQSWTQFQHSDAFMAKLPAYASHNLRLTLSSPSEWNLSVFVNNFTNESATVSKVSQPLFGGLDKVRAISLPPRSAGLELTKSF